MLGQLIAAGGAVDLILGGVDAARLGEDLGGDPLVAAGRLLARHRRQLRPVESDHPDLDQPGLGAEAEDLAKELAQGGLVADSEAGDRRVVWHLVGADHPEGDVLATAALDLPRGALADRVGIGEQGQHHLWVVSRCAVAVFAVGGEEGLKIELLASITNQARWSSSNQSRRSGGSNSGWSRSQLRKFWGMGPFSRSKRTD